MKNLIEVGISKNHYAPEMNLNAETGICELFGESYLEAPIPFYNRIMDWLKEYMENERGPIEFNFKFLYFNTSSSRCILDILCLLKEYQTTGAEVTIKWFYDPSNRMAMTQEVEDFSADSELEITMYPLR